MDFFKSKFWPYVELGDKGGKAGGSALFGGMKIKGPSAANKEK